MLPPSHVARPTDRRQSHGRQSNRVALPLGTEHGAGTLLPSLGDGQAPFAATHALLMAVTEALGDTDYLTFGVPLGEGPAGLLTIMIRAISSLIKADLKTVQNYFGKSETPGQIAAQLCR